MNTPGDEIYRGWTIRLIKGLVDYDFYLYDTEGARADLHEDQYKPEGYVDREAAIKAAKKFIDGYSGKNAPLEIAEPPLQQ